MISCYWLCRTLHQDRVSLNIFICSRKLLQDYSKYTWTKEKYFKYFILICVYFIRLKSYHPKSDLFEIEGYFVLILLIVHRNWTKVFLYSLEEFCKSNRILLVCTANLKTMPTCLLDLTLLITTAVKFLYKIKDYSNKVAWVLKVTHYIAGDYFLFIIKVNKIFKNNVCSSI